MPRNRSEKLTPEHQDALNCLAAMRGYAETLASGGHSLKGEILSNLSPAARQAWKTYTQLRRGLLRAFQPQVRASIHWAQVANEYQDQIERWHAEKSK